MDKTANIHGTDGVSLTVGLPDQSFEDICRALIAGRVVDRADTPKGHARSNLIEQLKHYRTATGEQKANLAKAIPVQMARLQAA